jgi:hypothetical protein
MLQASLAAWPSLRLPFSRPLAKSIIAGPATSGSPELFRDDFSNFRSGWLTRPFHGFQTAIQENHWVDARARTFGAWSNGVPDQDAWLVSMEAATGKPYMMQQLYHMPNHVSPVLIGGEDEWADYAFQALVRPLVFDGVAGIAFRYQNNLQYYVLGLSGGDTVQINVQHLITDKFRRAGWETVASAPFNYNTQQYYLLKVENQGPIIRAYVDGKKVLEVSDAKYGAGKIGLSANIPARYQEVLVQASPEVKEGISNRIHQRNARLAQLQKENPKPQLWRKFSVEGFGAGSSVRFGDLDGDGEIEMLIAQNIQTVLQDDFDMISCLTAVKLDGKVLWQVGKPNPDPFYGLLTNDLPFQIHDVDGDGRNEVVTIRDFKLQVLDGATGKLKKWAWTPKAPEVPKPPSNSANRAYERVFGDSLFFVNVSGNPNRHEILIKDRYQYFWVLNNKLELLWKGEGQTGHCPYPFDVNGYDRIMMGYSMWDHTGAKLWSHDTDLLDHADSIAVVDLSANSNDRPRVYSTGSDEGFLMFSYDGQILKHLLLGHAQCSSAGRYRTDLPGLQFMMITFHRNVGVLTLFDGEGNILQTAELIHNGSKLVPVNWRGDGEEFVLLSTDAKYGGMINGRFERAVTFPDDGHPDLASFALDLTGDGRDEVVTWDERSVWIYTQDRPFQGSKIYAPVRNPLYNMSNYSSIISKPGWKNV